MTEPEPDPAPFRCLEVTRGSHVKAKRLIWWEPGLVLQSALNLLAAREGKGKSTVGASWAARETNDGGTVLWIGTEESREHAIVPRLIGADADMDRVIFVDVKTELGTGALQLPLDLVGIKKVIAEHAVTMLVIDPAKAVVPPGFSGNDDIAVRQYLEPIADLAHRCNVTIIGLAHFGKRAGNDSGQLLLGSVAWSQVARCVLSIAENPDTDTRVITNTKANYAPDDRSVEFRIVATTVATDDGPTEMGRVEWLGDTTVDARDLLGDNQGDDARAVDRWLTDFLANGPVKATEVYSATDAAGYSKDQAKRAKKRLRITAEKLSGDGPWVWALPDAIDQGSVDQGSTPVTRGAAPLLPCTSDGVQKEENRPREQPPNDCSLGQLSPPTPLKMPATRHLEVVPPPRQRQRTYRQQPAGSYPECTVCAKPVMAGQGETHLSCSNQEASV